MDESSGRLKASVQSAFALSDPDKINIAQKLSKIFQKEIFLDVAVNPALLAGMVIQTGDTVIDNSLRSQLKNMKSRLLDHGN